MPLPLHVPVRFVRRQTLAAIFLVSAFVLGWSLASSAQIPSTSRPQPVLSLSINPRSVPPPTQQDFEDAVNLAISAGVKGVALTYTWSTLEPTPGHIDVSQVEYAINYFNARGLQIFLGIQVINTVVREVPPDLKNVPFDSPQMAARFHALLDKILPVLVTRVRYVSIGNEVDVYLGQTGEWSTYRKFYEDGLNYLHQRRPGTAVGVTATFTGTRNGNVANVQALNRKSDVVIFTYYPLHGDFQVDAPTVPATDFPLMLSWAGTKPVLLQEVGYPSDSATGSSPALEQQFVTAAFSAWKAGGTRMPFFNYFLEHDFDPPTCAAFAKYYGLPNDLAFVGYLCSLGLRADDDTVKPAWDSFVTGAAGH